jgi:hypothetical protein
MVVVYKWLFPLSSVLVFFPAAASSLHFNPHSFHCLLCVLCLFISHYFPALSSASWRAALLLLVHFFNHLLYFSQVGLFTRFSLGRCHFTWHSLILLSVLWQARNFFHRSPQCEPVYYPLLSFLNYVFVMTRLFLSQNSKSIWPLWFLLPSHCGPTMCWLFQSPSMTVRVLHLPSYSRISSIIS